MREREFAIVDVVVVDSFVITGHFHRPVPAHSLTALVFRGATENFDDLYRHIISLYLFANHRESHSDICRHINSFPAVQWEFLLTSFKCITAALCSARVMEMFMAA